MTLKFCKTVFSFISILLFIIRPTKFKVDDVIFFFVLFITLLIFLYDNYLRYKKGFLSEVKKIFTQNYLIFILGLWSLLTFLWSAYPIDSLLRGTFLYLVLFLSYYFTKDKKLIIPIFIILNVIVLIIASILIIYDFGLSVWSTKPQGFRSFFAHKNTFAAYLLFSIPINILYLNGNRDKVKKYLISGIIIVNSLFIIISYSRAAILTVFIFYIMIYKIFLYPKLFKTILVASIFLIAVIINFNEEFLRIITLNSPENLLGTRIHLWDASYEAAKSGGILGFGLGISDPDIIIDGSGSYFLGGKYIREKGNGILALTEETGYTGLIIFIFMILLPLSKLKFSEITNSDKLVIISIFIFLIHTMFEAWLVGVTTFQLMVFYFMVFSLYQIKNKV